MTGDIFRTWLAAFNKDMRLQNRHVLLLVDNCSAHPQDAAKKLTNVQLSFLPPNTTSVIQPCDQGIIRNLKALYRRQVVKKMIEDIDGQQGLSANELARKLTLLDAIHMLAKAWSNVKEETIKNCYKKAGFVKTPMMSDTTTEASPATTTVQHPDSMTADTFEVYVNHDEDLECHGMPKVEDICSDLLREEEEERNHIEYDADSEDDEPVQLPATAGDARNGLTDVRRFLEDSGCSDYSLYYQMEELVEKYAAMRKRQTKMTEYVDWIP